MKAIDILCEDSFIIKSNFFPACPRCKRNKVVIINSATGISKDLYKNYATYLAENGFDSLTYDYRGIAESRPKKLKGFKATFTTWGKNDFASVLNYIKDKFPQHKILVLGHSIGGTIIGMAENCNLISGIINIGAQTSYYKDWNKHKYKLYFLWHFFFPLMTNIYGFLPGRKFRLMEDIPKGVIKQWNARKNNPNMIYQLEKEGNKLYYSQYKGKLLTLMIDDDIIGTKKAIKRVHVLFTSADKVIEYIKPKDFGVEKIGHFGFFSRKFNKNLWQKSAEWFAKT